MSVSYLNSHKKQVRVTLDFDVLSDFDARQIDWRKLFDLDNNESVDVHVEDVDIDW